MKRDDALIPLGVCWIALCIGFLLGILFMALATSL